MNIEQALDAHQDRLMAVPGVTGLGIGEKDGSPAIVILISQLTPALKERLPEVLEGYPVVIEQSGEIVAFWVCSNVGFGTTAISEAEAAQVALALGNNVAHIGSTAIPNSAETVRPLAFCDFMTAHPDRAQQYSGLKRRMATQYSNDINGYMDGKDKFVKTMERRVLEWWGIVWPNPEWPKRKVWI